MTHDRIPLVNDVRQDIERRMPGLILIRRMQALEHGQSRLAISGHYREDDLRVPFAASPAESAEGCVLSPRYVCDALMILRLVMVSEC